MKNPPAKQSLDTEVTKAVDSYLAAPDIHDVQREKIGGFVTLVAAFVVFILETLLVYAVMNNYTTFAIGLFVHVALVAILYAAFARVLAGASEERFMLLLFIVVLPTGPFGAAGMMLAIVMYLWHSRHALEFEEWFSSIFPHQPQTIAQMVNDDILTGRDESGRYYSVVSFIDILSFGNEAQKRRAISKVISNFRPNFAPVLQKALSDNSNTIRVLAATGIGKIESQFLNRMIKLTELKARHSKDPLVVWALAEHYDNYAYTGLLDADREQVNRQSALELYKEYLSLKPGDIEPRNRIGRILMRDKEYAQACDWFQNCIRSGYTSDTISEWYSEALFNCGRYEELRRYRATLPRQTTSSNQALNDALLLWSGSKI